MKSIKDMVQPVLADIGSGKKTIEISELWAARGPFFCSGSSTRAKGRY